MLRCRVLKEGGKGREALRVMVQKVSDLNTGDQPTLYPNLETESVAFTA